MYHQYNYIERGRVSETLWRPHFYDVFCVLSYFYMYFLFSYIHTYRLDIYMYIHTWNLQKCLEKSCPWRIKVFLFTYITYTIPPEISPFLWVVCKNHSQSWVVYDIVLTTLFQLLTIINPLLTINHHYEPLMITNHSYSQSWLVLGLLLFSNYVGICMGPVKVVTVASSSA